MTQYRYHVLDEAADALHQNMYATNMLYRQMCDRMAVEMRRNLMTNLYGDELPSFFPDIGRWEDDGGRTA